MWEIIKFDFELVLVLLVNHMVLVLFFVLDEVNGRRHVFCILVFGFLDIREEVCVLHSHLK